MKLKTVSLDDIVIDGGTQQRVEISAEVVTEYAEAMRNGAKFPPMVLFFDGARYWLADGFHRYHAQRAAEIDECEAEAHPGIQRDAILYSTGANGSHGIRPTNADKRRSVTVLLTDPEWTKWSDRDIAKHCRVTQPLVSKVRAEILFGFEKKGRVKSVITLTPEAAPVLDIAKPAEDGYEDNTPTDYDKKDFDLQEAVERGDYFEGMVEGLHEQIAIGALPTEEQADAAQIIKELKEENKDLKAELVMLRAVNGSLKATSGMLLTENADLKQAELARKRRDRQPA